MSRLQSLGDLNKDEFKNILDSIDYVFLDIDGVLLHNKTIIPGAKEGVEKLRKLEKKIMFVSNNSIYPLEVILANLKQFGATEDEVVTPNNGLLAYLRKIDFKKDIYVITSFFTKKLLREAGFNVIEYKDIYHNKFEERLGEFENLSLKALEVCKNVGAVLVDMDFNINLGALQAAKVILNYVDDVLFLSGLIDDTVNVNEKMKIVAPKFYIDGLERWTNRKPIAMGKPGIALKDVLNTKFNISDDSRVLFIGDNVNTDIAFGVNCGYKTCLVYSGVTSKSQVDKWIFPENFKPTYVSEGFKEIYEKIKDLYTG